MGFPTPAQSQDFKAVDDSPLREPSERSSLESLKKRSPETQWKSIKGRTRPSLWKPVTERATKSSTQPEKTPESKTPTPVKKTFVPVVKSSDRQPAVSPATPQQLPVFNLTEQSAVKRTAELDRSAPPVQRTFPVPAEVQNPVIREAPQPDDNEPSFDPIEHAFDPAMQTVQNQTPQERQLYTPSPLQKITEISPFSDYVPKGYELEPDGEVPQIEELSADPYVERNFEEIVFTWEPTNLSYNPLYFEDAPLERYGHTHHDLLQPFVSATRFGVQLIGLPYQMTIDPIYKRRYTLGYYRPGEYAPKKFYQIPLNFDAALVEAGTLTGMFFLIP